MFLTTKLGAFKKPSIQYALLLSLFLKTNKKIIVFMITKSHQQCPSFCSFFFILMLMCGIKCEYGIFWVLNFLAEGYNLMFAVKVALVWNPDLEDHEQQLVWEYW